MFQISDHTSNYQVSKNGAYPSKFIRLSEIFHKEKYLLPEKNYPDGMFANQHKNLSKRKRLNKGDYFNCWLLYPTLKNLPTEKCYK